MEPTEQVMDSVIDAISVAEMNAQIKQKTTVLSAKVTTSTSIKGKKMEFVFVMQDTTTQRLKGAY